MILQLAVLALAAAGLAILVYLGVRRPVLFLGLAALWLGWGRTAIFFGTEIGSYSVYAMDVVVALTWSIGFARFRPSRMPIAPALTTILWASATAVGVLFWSLTLDTETAAVFWRPMLLTVGLFVYTLTSGVRWGWENISRVIVVPALVLLIPPMVVLAQRGLWVATERSSRPYEYDITFMFLLALFVVSLRAGPWTAARWAQALALATGVVLMQHRSVWVAAAAGGVVLILFSRSVPVAARVASVAFGIPLVALAINSMSELKDSSTDTESWEWRVAQVQDLLQIDRLPTEWLFGTIFGQTPVTQIPMIRASSYIFTGGTHMLVGSMIDIFGVAGVTGLVLLLIAVAMRRIGTVPIGLVVVAAVIGLSLAASPPYLAMVLMAMLLTYDVRTGLPFEPRPVVRSRARPQVARTGGRRSALYSQEARQ